MKQVEQFIDALNEKKATAINKKMIAKFPLNYL